MINIALLDTPLQDALTVTHPPGPAWGIAKGGTPVQPPGGEPT